MNFQITKSTHFAGDLSFRLSSMVENEALRMNVERRKEGPALRRCLSWGETFRHFVSRVGGWGGVKRGVFL